MFLPNPKSQFQIWVFPNHFITIYNPSKKGLFAFHMEVGVGYKIIGEKYREDEKCGIQEIPYLEVTDPWYAIKKNSSYKEMFKIG